MYSQQGSKKKKAYIEHILEPYLTRTYINTKKLASIIKDLSKLPENEIFNLAKTRGAMMRYMYIEGGIQTQYAPISSPVNLQHKDIRPSNNDDAKSELENVPDGTFDDVDELDIQEQSEIDKTKNNNESEHDHTPQNDTSNEVPETPVKEITTADEIAAYKKGIEEPEVVMNN
eukprot:scaffold61686_cov47-Cyclotella_meneghiniana.AAC.1